MVTVKVTTDVATTTSNFTDRIAAYKYALHLAESGYENVEIREGV
jgi:hypothetical protein